MRLSNIIGLFLVLFLSEIALCNKIWDGPDPILNAKPYSIGVAPSHIAEPIGAMFAADAPWKEGLAGVDTFRYYGCQAGGVKWATKLNVPDYVAFCKRNNLRVACEFGDFVVGAGSKWYCSVGCSQSLTNS